jgi:hypothetical protein
LNTLPPPLSAAPLRAAIPPVDISRQDYPAALTARVPVFAHDTPMVAPNTIPVQPVISDAPMVQNEGFRQCHEYLRHLSPTAFFRQLGQQTTSSCNECYVRI